MEGNENAAVAARIRELVAELDDSPVGERLRDPSFHHRHVCEALLHNPDPVMREIGRQVRDGQMRISDVLRVPEYADAFRGAARSAAERLDPKDIARQLEELAAANRDGGPEPDDRSPQRRRR